MLPRPLVIALAVLISIMWAANLIVGFLYPGRSDPALNAIFAIVAGSVFALRQRDTGQGKSVRHKIAKLIEPEATDRNEEDEQRDRGGQS